MYKFGIQAEMDRGLIHGYILPHISRLQAN